MRWLIKGKNGKKYNLSKILMLIIFLRNIHTGVLLIEDADKDESMLLKELRDIKKG